MGLSRPGGWEGEGPPTMRDGERNSERRSKKGGKDKKLRGGTFLPLDYTSFAFSRNIFSFSFFFSSSLRFCNLFLCAAARRRPADFRTLLLFHAHN